MRLGAGTVEAAEKGLRLSEGSEEHPSGTEQAGEKLKNPDEMGERHSSGAEARADAVGIMRGLKPLPPSELRFFAACFAVALMALVGQLSGCHSYQIDVGVENRTGQAIDLVEIDYPSASFGIDTLAAGAEFQYHFKVRGSGPLSVQYTGRTTRQVRQISGPSLYERQEGRLDIILLPDGKAEFHPVLSPRP